MPLGPKAWRVDEWEIRQKGLDTRGFTGHSKMFGLRALGEGSYVGVCVCLCV